MWVHAIVGIEPADELRPTFKEPTNHRTGRSEGFSEMNNRYVLRLNPRAGFDPFHSVENHHDLGTHVVARQYGQYCFVEPWVLPMRGNYYADITQADRPFSAREGNQSKIPAAVRARTTTDAARATNAPATPSDGMSTMQPQMATAAEKMARVNECM